MAKLVVITKGLAPRSCELGAHWVTIGRSATNNFQIPEASVSGQHCEVLLTGEELQVRDMRSTNGTLIRGVLVTEGVLQPGEVLRLGEVELRFERPATTPQPPKISLSVSDPSAKSGGAIPATPNFQENPRAPQKHQILLVDDSMAFLETIGEMFDVLSDRTWDIHKAASADQALSLLQQHQIELAVLDINLPMLDGVQLLGVIQRRHPEVKKVILTAHASDTHRASCLANGAELFLEKPVTPEGIVAVFNLLNDLVAWSQREGFSGTLRQVGLTDVIQIECLRRSSCILEVHNPDTSGAIFIESGVIVHATAAALTGDLALYQLLAMSNGQFRLQPFNDPAARTVEGSWEYLLMEAARRRDEAASNRTTDETVVIAKSPSNPKPTAASLAPLAENLDYQEPGADFVIVSTYDGKWHPVEGPK